MLRLSIISRTHQELFQVLTRSHICSRIGNFCATRESDAHESKPLDSYSKTP